MNIVNFQKNKAVIAAAICGGLAALLYSSSAFLAHAATDDPAEARQRCAIRLSAALLGKSATAEWLSSENPQSQVDTMLASAEFITRFSAFINATFNSDPGADPAEDAPYYLTKHVLENDLPWKDLFVGQYTVELSGDQAVVRENADGVGYFRAPAWLKRYAGNEGEGYKLVTAYRILNNTIGMKLTATTNAPEADLSATGRQAGACRGCHYDPWYALDKLAKVLTRRKGTGDNITFDPPNPADLPQTLVDGISISNDKELITALVESEAFRYRQCRLAFMYLYGRPENKSEGEIFDKCMTAFEAAGTIQSAISAVATDPSFCQ